jgi:hypothetical protein
MKNFKGLTIILLLVVIFCRVNAQGVPQGINYQGIAENASGTPLINQTIGIKIAIHAGTSGGIIEWEETHSPLTDQFGLFSIVIGQGNSTGSGTASSFSLVNWGAGNHYLEIAMDITGGTNYNVMDNSQLLSVPYALFSAKSGSVIGNISMNDLADADTSGTSFGKVLKWNGSQWKPAKDNNSDTAQFAYSANFAHTADTALYAINSSPSDTALFSFSSDSSVYANTAATSQNAAHSIHSDTAAYALNCANITNDWHITGNTGITAPGNFIGTINAADFVIKTNNVERMRITSGGKIGIATTIPSASLHMIGNDGFIAQGTFGTGTALSLGAGTRMMWYPKKAAFRAGYVVGTQWDDVNIGNYSFSTGISSTAKGIAAVAMGQQCSASDSCAVAMGYATVASGKYSVALGNVTVASGYASVALGRGASASGNAAVSIGYHCSATGSSSTAFGYYSTASGNNSVAMGFRSSTNNYSGSFVFSDNSSNTIFTTSTANNQFMVRASGGTIFYSNTAMTSGVSLAAGGGGWLTLSDRNYKEHFKKPDGEMILKKISEMEITSWNYKSQPATIRHIGPMAQDFYAAFKFGESDTTITTTDIDGINMIAIQELAKRTNELKLKADEIKLLKNKVDELSKEKAELTKRITAIEEKMVSDKSKAKQ